MPESRATHPPKRPPIQPLALPQRPVAGPERDVVRLFAEPIARAASPPGDPMPISETLYRMADGRYVIRTCLDGGDPTCDVMIYADADAVREALSTGDLDQDLLVAAGLDRA